MVLSQNLTFNRRNTFDIELFIEKGGNTVHIKRNTVFCWLLTIVLVLSSPIQLLATNTDETGITTETDVQATAESVEESVIESVEESLEAPIEESIPESLEESIQETEGIALIDESETEAVSTEKTTVVVAPGTAEAALGLPSTLTKTLEDGTTEDVSVTWSCTNYDSANKGVYEFTATETATAPVGLLGVEPRTLAGASRLVVVAVTCTCTSAAGATGEVHDIGNVSCPLYGLDTVRLTMSDGTVFIVAEADAEIYTVAGATREATVFGKTVVEESTYTSGTNDTKMNNTMKTVAKTTYSTSDSPTGLNFYSTGETAGMELPWDWRNYVNTIWQYRAMGEGNTSGDYFQWTKDLETNQGLKPWTGIMASKPHTWLSGTKLDESDVIAAGQTIAANDPAQYNQFMVPFSTQTVVNNNAVGQSGRTAVKERTFYVWSGEQFLYALKYATTYTDDQNKNNTTVIAADPNPSNKNEPAENRPKGGTPSGATDIYAKITIVLMRDLDMNGENVSWPIVSLYKACWPRLEIQGNDHTIYNFSQYKGSNSGARASGLVIGHAGVNAENVTFQSAKLVASSDSQTVAMGIFGRAETGNGGNPTYYSGANNVDYGESTLTNVVVRDSMFFSGVQGGQSNVSAFGEFARNGGDNSAAPALIKNCSVENCYIYGGDHAAGITTGNTSGKTIQYAPGRTKIFDKASIDNTYVVDTLIATYGGHSGGFASCAIRNVDIANCFADVDMYAAAFSGGFLGLASGTVTNCFSTGKLEGFQYCGGFMAVVDNGGIYDGTVVTNCYSTVLTGMRQQSQNMGGFYSPGKSGSTGAIRVAGVVTMKNCYAAGEVGDTGIDTSKDSDKDKTRASGGFSASLGDGYGTTGYDSVIGNFGMDSASFCYYDKQTSAMKEWVSGNHNSRNGLATDINGGNVINNVTGVMTRSYTDPTTRNVTGGLVGDPTGNTSGFTGFSNDADGEMWEYSNYYYPQLKVFSQPDATQWSAAQLEVVKRYSQISTATVYLEPWNSGYEWDDDGIRTTNEVNYNDNTTEEDHKGSLYTYDTVRDMIKDAQYSPSGDITGKRLVDSILGTVETDNKITGETSQGNAYTIDNVGHFFNIRAPGMGWFGLSSGDGSRPIRLISSLNLEAGDDQHVYAGEAYDHREGVRLAAAMSIENNMILGLDDNKIWSKVVMGGFSTLDNVPPSTECEKDSYSKEYFMAYSKNIDSYVDPTNAIYEAWVNTEIWRVYQVYPDDMPDVKYVPENGRTYDEINAEAAMDGKTYTPPALPAGYDDGNYYWFVEKDEDNNVGVYLRRYSSENHAIVSRENDRYVESHRVLLDNTVSYNDSLDKQKWIGEKSLYPDTSSAKKYVISYYWVLDDGRYVSDYKTVSVKPGYYNMYMNAYTFNPVQENSITNPNAESLYLSANKDTWSRDDANNKYVYTSNIDLDTSGTHNNSYIAPPVAGGFGGTTDLDRRGEDIDHVPDDFGSFKTSDGENGSLKYTEDATAAWLPLNESVVIKKIRLTMYARSGDVMGQVTAPLITYSQFSSMTPTEKANESYIYQKSNGIWEGQIVFEGEYYGASVDSNNVESTTESKETVKYILHHELQSGGSEVAADVKAYFFSFSKRNGTYSQTEGNPPWELAENEDYSREGTSGSTTYINDIQYNVRLDFFIETYDLAIEKEVHGNYGNLDDVFPFEVTLTRNDSVAEYRMPYLLHKGQIEEIGYITFAENSANAYEFVPYEHNMPIEAQKKTKIELSDGDYLLIGKIPKNVEYTIEEVLESPMAERYSTDIMYKLDDTGLAPYNTVDDAHRLSASAADPTDYTLGGTPVYYRESQRKTYSKFVASGAVEADNQYILYINSTDYVPPTGKAKLNGNVYLVIVMIIATAACVSSGVYLGRQKKRRRKRF